mgnify:CR=1 FL=1
MPKILKKKKKKKLYKKGGTTKDACYHKVKARYKVWPSAYGLKKSGERLEVKKVIAARTGHLDLLFVYPQKHLLHGLN